MNLALLADVTDPDFLDKVAKLHPAAQVVAVIGATLATIAIAYFLYKFFTSP